MIRLRIALGFIALLTDIALAGEGRLDARDLHQIAKLGSAHQRKALQAFLEAAPDEDGLLDEAIYEGARLRDSWRALLREPKVAEQARTFLALLGAPDDLHLIVQLAPPPKIKDLDYEWAYGVVCTLIEPTSDGNWAFLRRAAFNEYDNLWVDAGAIQTLKLIASPRSRQILIEAREHNPDRAKSISEALAYIDSGPAPLADENLERLAACVAQAVRIGSLGRKQTASVQPGG